MALSGSLLDFGFTDILQLLKMQRKTGRLTLTSREQSIALWFREGDLIFAKDDDRPLAAAVGARLVQDGQVTEGAWRKALDAQQDAGRPLAEFLPDVEPDALAALAATYLRETVLAVFRWVEGDYTFDADSPLPPGIHAISVAPVQSDDLLMEAATRTDAWRALDATLPTWRLILAPEGTAPAEPGGGQKGAAPEVGDAPPPGPEEHVLDLLDGYRDVRAVVEMSRYGALETCQALARLKTDGRAHVVGETAPRAARRARATAKKVRTGRRAQAIRRSPFRAVLVGMACMAMMVLTGWLAFESFTQRGAGGESGLLASTLSYRDHQVRQALRVYYLTHGAYPESLAVLARAGLLGDGTTTEGLRYSRTGDGFILSSG